MPGTERKRWKAWGSSTLAARARYSSRSPICVSEVSIRARSTQARRPVWKLYGSLQNLARRLLDSIRFVAWGEAWFDPRAAAKVHIGLDGSEAARRQGFSGSGKRLPQGLGTDRH